VQQKAYDEQKKQQQTGSPHTDILRVGEMQPERDHNFAGETDNRRRPSEKMARDR